MNSLITTLLAIALSTAILLTTINYLPSWQPIAAKNEGLTRAGLERLELAHYLATRAAAGVEPSPTAEADGGLVTNFAPYYTFLPRAPINYTWKYGYNATKGLNWVCLYSATGGQKADWMAFSRLKTHFSAEQYFVHTGGSAACGSDTNAIEPTEYPASFSVTFFLAYIAGT